MELVGIKVFQCWDNAEVWNHLDEAEEYVLALLYYQWLYFYINLWFASDILVIRVSVKDVDGQGVLCLLGLTIGVWKYFFLFLLLRFATEEEKAPGLHFLSAIGLERVAVFLKKRVIH